jgi:hypothetical protein
VIKRLKGLLVRRPDPAPAVVAMSSPEPIEDAPGDLSSKNMTELGRMWAGDEITTDQYFAEWDRRQREEA